MRTICRLAVTCVLAAGVFGVTSGRADDAQDEQAIEALNNETLTPAQATTRTETLATKYGIEQARITQMRNDGMGWGEIEISLAIAQKLSAASTATPPLTMNDALTQVQARRTAGEGWGLIAKNLGFKLGEIVRSVRGKAHEQNIERGAVREQHERPEHVERPEHMGRPESTGRPQEPGRPETSDRPGRGGGSDR
ncbi:MAG: hypothetical protein HY343_06445 [Lentisphaerae bacterium]|nr:hypothetical protein [Lentisphaerota bacterium]